MSSRPSNVSLSRSKVACDVKPLVRLSNPAGASVAVIALISGTDERAATIPTGITSRRIHFVALLMFASPSNGNAPEGWIPGKRPWRAKLLGATGRENPKLTQNRDPSD